jgi:hypothetical protein
VSLEMHTRNRENEACKVNEVLFSFFPSKGGLGRSQQMPSYCRVNADSIPAHLLGTECTLLQEDLYVSIRAISAPFISSEFHRVV